MVLALMYRNNPRDAIRFFNDIPIDSLQIKGCTYCAERNELAMWAALDLDSMALADILAPKINDALIRRNSYGMLIMYYVWKKDTAKIDHLLSQAEQNTKLDKNWQYLVYLTGRLFLLRGDTSLSSLYAQKSIDVHQQIKGRMLGRSYYLNHQYDKALIYYKEAVKKKPKDAMFLAEIGMVYARKGDKDEALRTIDKLNTLRTDFEYGTTEYFQGRIYAVLDEPARAVALLETAIQKGHKFELWTTFNHDPDLMSLNDYPAYKELLANIK
jgi:tetratricopeptide (TPR) repeat protein